MGMEQTVTFARETSLAWPAISDLLARHSFPVQVRMIDGELAFPDEAPSPEWRDLRVGTPQGMVTLRRESDRVHVVTWGNADATLVQAWNALTWAVAAAGEGRILSANGPLTATEFQRSADLPPAIKSDGH
jgi:hypothetical protein